MGNWGRLAGGELDVFVLSIKHLTVACACIATLCTLALLASCQNSAAVPATGANSAPPASMESTGLAQLPAPTLLRNTSAAESWYFDEGVVVAEGGLIDADGWVSHSSETDLSYRIYRLGKYTAETAPSLATLHIGNSRALSLQVYFGIADFTRDTWRWHADLTPASTEATVILDPGSYIDPGTGEAMLVIAWYGEGWTNVNYIRGLLYGGPVQAHLENVTLKDAASLAALDGCNVVGNLTIEPGLTDYASLPNLELVLGNLWLKRPIAEDINLPASLQYVAGAFGCVDSSSTQSIEAPGLLYATCISLRENTALESCSFPSLTRCGVYAPVLFEYRVIYMSGNDLLTSIEAPNLQHVDGELYISQSDATTPTTPGTLSLPALQSTMAINISVVSTLERIELPALTATSGVSVYGQSIDEISIPQLQSLSKLVISCSIPTLAGFPASLQFANKSSISIRNCPALTSLAGLQGASGTGSMATLDVSACPLLTSLSGLEWVGGNVGRLMIAGNPSLTDISALSGVTSLGQVGTATACRMPSQGDPGDPSPPGIDPVLLVQDNDMLTDLNSLNLSTINGGVEISDNANLVNLAGWYSGSNLAKLLIEDNGQLTSLAGLESLEEVDALGISNNTSLASLQGLENLATCHNLSILGNPALTDLDPLNALHNTGMTHGISYLSICWNDSLLSLTGLVNLEPDLSGFVVNERFTVQDNHSLIGGDQAVWDLINVWGGSEVIDGGIYVSGNGS